MKILYIALGSAALGLGVAGIFLPVLPTTPFLLLAASLYFRGSPRLYEWLMGTRLGDYIRDFREHRAIPLRAKIVSVATLWATIAASAFWAVNALWLRVMLIIVAMAVTWHILSFRTRENRPKTPALGRSKKPSEKSPN
jgi:uncharacterized membrane protein YbaN (DUF454 family)